MTARELADHLTARGLTGTTWHTAYTTGMTQLADECRRHGHDYQVRAVTATDTTPGYPVEVWCPRCDTRWPCQQEPR